MRSARGGSALGVGRCLGRCVDLCVDLCLWLTVAMLAPGCHSHSTEIEPIGDPPDAGVCPTYLDLEFSARDSRFDPGWSGSTHGVGLARGSQLSVKIDECDPECRRCRFHGPLRGDPVKTPVVNQRCLQNISKICSTDGDCGSDTPCRFVFPPIASTISHTCTLAYFEPLNGADPVQGSINLMTADADMSVLNIQLSLRENDCVTCADDATGNDGIAGGKCEGTGNACDRHGEGTAVPSSTSFDCPPGKEITHIALGTNGTSTSSVVWKMDETRPLCTEKAAKAAGKRCWCGVCDDGSPCVASKDCKTGTCGAAMSPANSNILWNVANNSCPGKCNFDPLAQRGTCAGTSTTCFPDDGEMRATGATEVNKEFLTSQLANLICMPSFNTGMGPGVLVDIIGGFPGPFLFEARFRVETRFGP